MENMTQEQKELMELGAHVMEALKHGLDVSITHTPDGQMGKIGVGIMENHRTHMVEPITTVELAKVLRRGIDTNVRMNSRSGTWEQRYGGEYECE